MNKIGIIAGEGDLPKYIGDSLTKKNYNIIQPVMVDILGLFLIFSLKG